MKVNKIYDVTKTLFSGYRLSRNIFKDPRIIREIQNNAIRNAISFAYNETEFYREKYDKHGVSPGDIRSIDDLYKLPIITKKEFTADFEATIPKSIDRSNAFLMKTSGSTGQPVEIYNDYNWLSFLFSFIINLLNLTDFL